MTRTRTAAALLLSFSLAACSSTAASTPALEDDATHGFVAGAAEVEEQQRTLLSVSDSGSVDLLDLASEELTPLGEIGPVTGIVDDGRFVVAAGRDGALTVVDSGVWTTDHGDHVHYYRATPAVVGELRLTGTPQIVSTESRTAVRAGAEAVLLDRDQLGQGEIVELARTSVDPDGLAAPLDAEHWAVTSDHTLRVLELDGAIQAQAPCVEPRGGIVTRVGTVFGCADGALLVPTTDGPAAIESIPYPAGTDTATRASAFAGRTGRPTVAAVAPGRGFWLLDTRERSWQLVPTAEVPALVTAVDDSSEHVIGVLDDGAVVVWDATGAELGRASAAAGDVDETLRLTVDTDRAYLRGADPDSVLEIDFRDSARVARTLDIPSVRHLAEVGL